MIFNRYKLSSTCFLIWVESYLITQLLGVTSIYAVWNLIAAIDQMQMFSSTFENVFQIFSSLLSLLILFVLPIILIVSLFFQLKSLWKYQLEMKNTEDIQTLSPILFWSLVELAGANSLIYLLLYFSNGTVLQLATLLNSVQLIMFVFTLILLSRLFFLEKKMSQQSKVKE